jgi:hypothetical protein
VAGGRTGSPPPAWRWALRVGGAYRIAMQPPEGKLFRLKDLGGTTELEFSQGEFGTERRRALHDEGWANSLDRLHE